MGLGFWLGVPVRSVAAASEGTEDTGEVVYRNRRLMLAVQRICGLNLKRMWKFDELFHEISIDESLCAQIYSMNVFLMVRISCVELKQADTKPSEQKMCRRINGKYATQSPRDLQHLTHNERDDEALLRRRIRRKLGWQL